MADTENQRAEVDLEREKIALELTREKTKKFVARQGLWKVVVTSVIGAGLVAFINGQYQTRQTELERLTRDQELKLQEIVSENEHIRQFVEQATGTDLTRQRYLAEYFSRLSPSKDARGRWGNFLEYAKELARLADQKEKEVAILREKLAAKSEEVQVALAETQNAENQLTELARIQSDLASARRQEQRLRLETSMEDLAAETAERVNVAMQLIFWFRANKQQRWEILKNWLEKNNITEHSTYEDFLQDRDFLKLAIRFCADPVSGGCL